MLNHFRYVGPDQSSIGWVFATIGAVAIIVALWRKWKIKFVLIGSEIAFVIDVLLHVPAFYLLPVQVIAMAVGIYFDQRKINPAWNRKHMGAVGQVVGAIVAGIIYTVFMTFMFRRDITITREALIDTELQAGAQTTRIPLILGRKGIQASIKEAKSSTLENLLIGRSEVWSIQNPTPSAYTKIEIDAGIIAEVTLSHSDLFLDSSGHLLDGDDIGRLIAKWAAVEPTYKVP